jgi:hypothetical protein
MTLIPVEKQPSKHSDKSVEEQYELYLSTKQGDLSNEFRIKDETTLPVEDLRDRIVELDATRKDYVLSVPEFEYLMGFRDELSAN